MLLEHVFTSLPKGLNAGSRGFCTVAQTTGLTPPLVQLCESLSGYTHVFPLQSPDYARNPAACSHYRVTVGGRPYHVLSRVAAQPADYTGRTNKLAHHLLVPLEDATPAGPAAELAVPGRYLAAWEGDARLLPANRVSLSNPADPGGPAAAWQRAAGDAGWAGALARHWLRNPEGTAYLVFTPGTDPLPLFAEALRLIPPERRWEVTFSTYLTTPPSGVTCRWRGCLPDNPLLRTAARQAGTLVIDLARPGAVTAEFAADPLVRAARTGEPPAWTEAERHPPVRTRQAASADVPDTGLASGTPSRPRGPRRITSVKIVRPKRTIPLWLPPLAACAAIGLAAAYFMFDKPNTSQPQTTPADAAYTAVTNFLDKCADETKRIDGHLAELTKATNALNEIASTTNITDITRLTNDFCAATNQVAKAFMSAPQGQTKIDYQSLTNRADYAELSNAVDKAWNNWIIRKQTFDRLGRDVINLIINKAENKITQLHREYERSKKLTVSDGKSPPNTVDPMTNRVTNIEDIINKLSLSDPANFLPAPTKGLVSRVALSNSLEVARLHRHASELLNSTNLTTNVVCSLKANLLAACLPFTQNVKEILNAQSEFINAHKSATILQDYAFPTNETPEQIYLYDSQRSSITRMKAQQQLELSPEQLLAGNILAIQTFRAADTQTIWHLFNPDMPLRVVASSPTDWTLCHIATNKCGMICPSSSPLYQLVTGITQTFNPINITVYNKSWPSNAVFSVRQKNYLSTDAFKTINRLPEWINEIADEKTRRPFQKALKEFKEKLEDKKKDKTNDDGEIERFVEKWKALEKEMPQAERLRVMLSVTLSPPVVKPKTPPYTPPKLDVPDVLWAKLPSSTNQICDILKIVPDKYTNEFTHVLTAIKTFDVKQKDQQLHRIKDQWLKAKKEWFEREQKDTMLEADRKILEAYRKEKEADLKAGMSFDLLPVLKQLGWDIDANAKTDGGRRS